jgi:hypothetical protein
MELNTEMFMAIITFHMICFTDFIPERNPYSGSEKGLEARVQVGYSFIFWVCLLVAINIYFVQEEAVRMFKIRMIKRYRIFLLKYRPEQFKIHQEDRYTKFKDEMDKFALGKKMREYKVLEMEALS